MASDWRRKCHSIAAVRERARRVLPKAVFDFTDGGAEDETTLRHNEGDFQRLGLLPKPMNGPGAPDISIELFGRKLSLPVMIGPTGLAGLMWPGGEVLAANAAAKAGTAYCLSHGSVCALEAVIAIGDAPRWMQVFIYRDRGFTKELAQRAQSAGYDALVLTSDNQVLGNRERDVRNGFAIPPKFPARDMVAMAAKAQWLLRMRRELPRITFGNYVRHGEDFGSLSRRMGEILDPSMSWRDFDALRDIWKGPLILKGVLHPDEAREAVARGADAVIVSNHGGRQLDGAVSSIAALTGVIDAVAGKIPVLIDGGVRRGSDVVKALALGAACCLIARPQLWGLAIAGEAGVAHVLDIYAGEIARSMALMGAARTGELTRDMVVNALDRQG